MSGRMKPSAEARFRRRYFSCSPVLGDKRRPEPNGDKNRIEGAAKAVVGKVEDAVGGLTGDAETQAAGKTRQVAGKFQNAYGKAFDEVRNASKHVIET